MRRDGQGLRGAETKVNPHLVVQPLEPRKLFATKDLPHLLLSRLLNLGVVSRRRLIVCLRGRHRICKPARSVRIEGSQRAVTTYHP